MGYLLIDTPYSNNTTSIGKHLETLQYNSSFKIMRSINHLYDQ